MKKSQEINSPEKRVHDSQKKSLIARAISYYLAPIRDRYVLLKLRKLSRSHLRDKSLNWDWQGQKFNRVAITNLLVSKFTEARYLEIGCADDALFNAIPSLRKVGVDPLKGGTVRKTSDEFFSSNEDVFDVVFIDGLHTYSQVRTDLINAIQAISENGYILLHDMLPSNWIEAHVPAVAPGAWTGDVWKVAFEITSCAGLEFKIISVDHGVGVVKVLDKKAPLPDLSSELMEADFTYFTDNIVRLPVLAIEDAWKWLRAL